MISSCWPLKHFCILLLGIWSIQTQEGIITSQMKLDYSWVMLRAMRLLQANQIKMNYHQISSMQTACPDLLPASLTGLLGPVVATWQLPSLRKYQAVSEILCQRSLNEGIVIVLLNGYIVTTCVKDTPREQTSYLFVLQQAQQCKRLQYVMKSICLISYFLPYLSH